MASELDSVKAEIASVKRKIEEVEADINDVKAKRGIWSDVSTTEWLSHLDTLRKVQISLQGTRGSLQEEKNILLKRTPAGKSHVQFLKIRRSLILSLV